jgi:V/A-type H+-transporting ATPase subunit E
MDALGKMKEVILQEAQLKVDKIIEAAKRNAEEILREAQHEADSERERELAEAKKKANENARRISALADLEARKRLLSAKEELIKEVFEEAKTRLLSFKQEEYIKYLEKMLFDAASDGGGEVIMSEKDRSSIGEKLINWVNSDLKKAGHNSRVQLGESPGDFIGGFILRSGEIETNCTFDAILAGEYEALLVDVAELLFG